jgi:hypothetical protein
VRSIVVIGGVSAITHARRYGTNAALWTSVRGIGCDAARRFLATVLLAADERVALELAGWRVERIDRFRADGVRVHQTWAVQGAKRIIFVRRGDRPRVSRLVYRAGQALHFPRSDKWCSSNFVLRSRVDGSLFGLTAGHCSHYPFFDAAGTFQTEEAQQALGENANVPIGSVIQNIHADGNGPDAMIFTAYGAGAAAQEIYRRDGQPHRVVGVLPLSRQRKGRVVCYAGYISGFDRCGRIKGQSTFPSRVPVTCVSVRSDEGDSGGPVYTAPDRRGRVRAVGIVARWSIGGLGRDTCYTPIQTALQVFGAELPTGSFPLPPPPPPTPDS